MTGRVQGSRPDPYTVTIKIAAYDEAQWTTISAALAAQALYRAALLAGEMPHEIVEVFDGLGLPLFPTRLDMNCCCPDWSVPCKHVSAVLYVLAEAFDDDPFLVLAWRGRAATSCWTPCAPPPSRPRPSTRWRSRRCRWSPGWPTSTRPASR